MRRRKSSFQVFSQRLVVVQDLRFKYKFQHTRVLQGQKLRWAVTPSHDYAPAALPGEVIAAGDAQLHKQALQLLDWSEPDIADEGGKDVAYQTS